MRQPADVDEDVDSLRKTEMKDPSSEEGIQRILDKPVWMGIT